ncbi:MAG: methyltransferase domain-containing protein [Clostridia bacterium]|nr:methyltransferase domain-containing protein [Clostridia bacterium]
METIEISEAFLNIINCPSCKFGSLDVNYSKEIYCKSCGFLVPMVKEIPILVNEHTKINEYISETLSSLKGTWYYSHQDKQLTGPYRHHFKKRQIYVEGILKSYVKTRNGDVCGLDIGCGDGERFDWLSKFFNEFFASDYNLIRLARAKEKEVKPEIFMADITDYPCKDNSFDVIFFNHVLEHIQNDEKALKEVFRILKPGGLLILGVPNEGAFFWQLAYKLQPKVLKTTDHVHFYTSTSIAKKVKDAGFKISDIHYIGWGVPHWWLDAAIRRFKWIDDFLEFIGKKFFKKQASSLYLILTK